MKGVSCALWTLCLVEKEMKIFLAAFHTVATVLKCNLDLIVVQQEAQ